VTIVRDRIKTRKHARVRVVLTVHAVLELGASVLYNKSKRARAAFGITKNRIIGGARGAARVQGRMLSYTGAAENPLIIFIINARRTMPGGGGWRTRTKCVNTTYVRRQ